MATPKGRIRAGADKGFQGVSMQDNWRTGWFKNEETAQRHLDEHLEELGGGKKSAAKSHAKKAAAEPEVDGDALPPGGFDTGTRGGDESEPVPPGGFDTGHRGDE